MQASTSVQKRKHEEEAASAASQAAKASKQERRKRGHAAVPPKGKDAAVDTREKALQRIATKFALIISTQHCLRCRVLCACGHRTTNTLCMLLRCASRSEAPFKSRHRVCCAEALCSCSMRSRKRRRLRDKQRRPARKAPQPSRRPKLRCSTHCSQRSSQQVSNRFCIMQIILWHMLRT